MITLHLLRHGETVWHAENRYAGVSDVPLTDLGRAQAAALAPWAGRAGLALVASSDLSRALETAAPIAALGVPHVVDRALREVDFGAGDGRTRDEMAALFPEALDAFHAAPASSPLPGGENGDAAADRALTSIARLAGPHDGGTIAVVAHSTLIRLVLCRLLGLPTDDYRRRFPVMGNATVTSVRVPAGPASALVGAAALLRFNAGVDGL
jgi:broad specificity phosphatase PhoE